MPPEATTTAEPVLLPQADGVLPEITAVGAPGWVMVTIPTAAQPFMSVTVTLWFPGGRLVATAVVWLLAEADQR